MIPDTEEAIRLALAAAKAEERSRGASLAVTKLEEALFWLLEGRKEVASNTRFAGRKD